MPSTTTPAGNASGSWFATPSASVAIAEEQAELIPVLAGHIGVRGLFLRPSEHPPHELSGNMLQSVTTLHRSAAGWAGDLVCEDGSLPLGNECFSLVYLLHVLEQHPEPRLLLRECARCLQPEGLLVLLAFNPLSPYRRHWPRDAFRAAGGAALEALVRDVGLSVERRATVGRPFRHGAATGPRAAWLKPLLGPFCSSWALVARKRRNAPTLVGPATAGVRARATPL